MNELNPKHVLGTIIGSDFKEGNELFVSSDIPSHPDKSEFDVTRYLVYKGSLRQFRMKKCVVYPMNYGIREPGKRYIYRQIVELEIAGVGTLTVGGLYFTIYESVEDYKNGKEYKLHFKRYSIGTLGKVLGVKFIQNSCSICYTGGRYDPHRFFWNGTSVDCRVVKKLMPFSYQVTKDCISFYGFEPDSLGGYPTKEDCERENVINVCCFDEPKKFRIRAYETFSRTFEVEADSYESAESKVKKMLKEEPFSEGDSDGLCFD